MRSGRTLWRGTDISVSQAREKSNRQTSERTAEGSQADEPAELPAVSEEERRWPLPKAASAAPQNVAAAQRSSAAIRTKPNSGPQEI